MTQCKQCGTTLPDNARFCLQCGTPVEHEAPQQPQQVRPPAPPPQPLDFIQPALAGGMFLGFLSSMPFISAANIFCCLWVLLGGAIAAVLVSKQRPGGITVGDGAFAGVLSGLFGAIIGTIVQIPVQMLSARLIGSRQQELEDMLRRAGLEGPMKDWLLRVVSGEVSVGTILFTFFANLLMWSLFAMIGGILAVAILNKRTAQGKMGPPPAPFSS